MKDEERKILNSILLFVEQIQNLYSYNFRKEEVQSHLTFLSYVTNFIKEKCIALDKYPPRKAIISLVKSSLKAAVAPVMGRINISLLEKNIITEFYAFEEISELSLNWLRDISIPSQD